MTQIANPTQSDTISKWRGPAQIQGAAPPLRDTIDHILKRVGIVLLVLWSMALTIGYYTRNESLIAENQQLRAIAQQQQQQFQELQKQAQAAIGQLQDQLKAAGK